MQKQMWKKKYKTDITYTVLLFQNRNSFNLVQSKYFVVWLNVIFCSLAIGEQSFYIPFKVDRVDLSDDRLEAVIEGVGAQGNNRYEFELDFYLPVNPEV